jgi:hypothetical protein
MVKVNKYHYEFSDTMEPVRIDPRVPLFWKRELQPADPDKVKNLETALEVNIATLIDFPLNIFGFAAASPYEEDAALQKEMWKEYQIFPVVGFSVACVGGELGSMQLKDATEITEAEFHDAAQRGWEY